LIAALVIVGLIAGLGAIYISTKNPPKIGVQLYDLSKEIDFESNRVIDRGILEVKSPAEISKEVTGLASYYANTTPGADLIIVYGNEEYITGNYYKEESAGSAGISGGGAPIAVRQLFKESKAIMPKRMGGNRINVTFGDESYLFTLKQGENFYIVLQKQVGEEKIVAIG
jgi:hypothetical protein